jgi:hypothetical protein
MVVGYFDLGRGAKEVLFGSREGFYQFDQRLALSTKTVDNVGLALMAINKGEKAELSLKSSYRCALGAFEGISAQEVQFAAPRSRAR